MASKESKQTDLKYCKIVSYTNILKTRGNDKLYQEAIEASSKFNKRLCNERKMRIPFIDSQTTVAQANCMIWNMEYQRTKTDREGYIYSYPVKRWYKNRRLAFENDSSNMLHRLQLPTDLVQQQISINENGSHSLMDPNSSAHYHININHHHPSNHHNHASHHHHNNHHKANDDLTMKSNGRSVNGGLDHKEWHDSYDNEGNNDNDNDADSDVDDFEDSKKGKKTKRGRGKTTKSKDSATAAAAANGDDKPFVCSHCGVKYKTKPGLSYHVQKAHGPSSSTHTTTNHTPSNASKTHDLIENENTNSVFDSVYDDMNSSSSLPQASSSHQGSSTNTNFSATLQANNIHSSSGKNAANRCGTCNGTESESRTGQSETFVTCCECNKSFHPLCLNFTPNMIKSIKKIKWQCIECKRCTICGNSENDDKLLFCDDCDGGYHMYCLNPPLKIAPEGDWRCEPCVKEYGAQS